MQHPQIKHPDCTAKTAGRAYAAGVRATGTTRLAYVYTGDVFCHAKFPPLAIFVFVAMKTNVGRLY